MEPVRFLLDGKPLEVAASDPSRTLLQYLREDLRRVGSKEGCAEGDCGACTVVVAELVDDALQYRAVNSCILFLPTLDGKVLYTVESLIVESPMGDDGSLHPVQQSMVDYHASQCGFCTPGFVMSMFALYHNKREPTRAEIDDALSGNLCRCTGYRPIVDACVHMYDYPRIEIDAAGLAVELRAIQRESKLSLEFEMQQFHAPLTTAELADLYLHNPQAQILAGGTDVGLWVTKQLRELPAVIYLGKVAELKHIDVSADGIEVGAAVTLTDAFDEIVRHYPELGEMFRRFASPPVRNAGTLVGNVANGSPIGDSMPALIALGTRLRLRRGAQQRQIALEDFYLDYMKNAMQEGEFIESILVPARNDGLLLRCYKLSKRFDQDISAVCATFALRLDAEQVSEICIALGGMAAIPKRASLTEKWLLDKTWNDATVREAMDRLRAEFTPMSDMRASADYRSRATANLLYRFYLETRPGEALQPGQVNVFVATA